VYPIAWGVCEGGNLISPDSEAVFYGILDFLAKPCFGALLIWGHKGIDPARLGLAIKDYDGDAVVHEKRHPVGLLLYNLFSSCVGFANMRFRMAQTPLLFPTTATTTLTPPLLLLLSKQRHATHHPFDVA
jgi:hypothetical protein